MLLSVVGYSICKHDVYNEKVADFSIQHSCTNAVTMEQKDKGTYLEEASIIAPQPQDVVHIQLVLTEQEDLVLME